MAGYENTTDGELRSRASQLLTRIDRDMREIAPVLTRIGNDRAEAQLIIEEMHRRGLLTGPGKDANAAQV